MTAASAPRRSQERRLNPKLAAAACFALAWLPAPALAQGSAASASPVGLLVGLGILALLPFLLIMVTSFVKVAVVLSLLRSAIGAQQVPPNQVITGLAIVLSIYIMAPVGITIYQELGPRVEQLQTEGAQPGFEDYRDLARRAAEPLGGFLKRHAHSAEKQLLYELAWQMRAPEQRAGLGPDSLIILTPAFVVSQLKEAFTIGFILFVPFIIVDMVIANILLSLGMHMLSPTTISLPFKLLLFVLVDGWFLVVKGLVLGYV